MQPARPADQPEIRIDLYSDTSTKPTPEMREFMCRAQVGDEQKGEDPSVNQLQDMVADLLGKETAVLLPSGTMCNQIAFAVHCNPGDMVLCDRSAHPLHSEAGGVASLAGATMYPIDGRRGRFTAAQVEEEMTPPTRYWPGLRGISVEQTTNRPGGFIWPLEQMREVCQVARSHGAITHMDGARLFNAVVTTRISARDYSASFDSVWIDLSKGLGAPVGGVLAGTREFIGEAWRWKQRIGGAMRQAGIIAAGGLYALEHNVERLAEDHRHARILAEEIAGCPGIAINPEQVETNMVRFDVGELGLASKDFADQLLRESGIRVSAPIRTKIRAIPHLGITEADVREAAGAIRALAEKLAAAVKEI